MGHLGQIWGASGSGALVPVVSRELCFTALSWVRELRTGREQETEVSTVSVWV